jgi:hypothetical protein
MEGDLVGSPELGRLAFVYPESMRGQSMTVNTVDTTKL